MDAGMGPKQPSRLGREQEHLDKISDIKGVQLKIEWGSQIRSYVAALSSTSW